MDASLDKHSRFRNATLAGGVRAAVFGAQGLYPAVAEQRRLAQAKVQSGKGNVPDKTGHRAKMISVRNNPMDHWQRTWNAGPSLIIINRLVSLRMTFF
jgi:hypothetical protein